MPATPEAAKAGPLRLLFDTTVLSNFAAVGQVSLLEGLYRDSAATTLMVAEEIQRGIDAGYEYLRSAAECLTAFSSQGWLRMVSLDSAEEQSLYAILSASLGAGEASCLSEYGRHTPTTRWS
jgi:predicted nucleic acid-binding protein